LALLLRNLCIELKGVEGKVLNNKINPSNLFLRSDGLHLAEWGYASFRDEFTIRENRFEKRRYGVLKGERDWFVSPEYLAPEIIRQMLGDDECDVWESRGSPDVWSLGVTFFELITLIPVWVSSKCSLLHRPTVSRCGILSAPGR
jgi:serine/threonine protein kinase